MTIYNWDVIDADHDGEKGYRDDFAVGHDTHELSNLNVRVEKQSCLGGMRDGVDKLIVTSGKVKFVVLPTRGMSLWKAYRDDFEFGWKSPVQGPVHPKFVPLTEPGGLGWLDGFDELLVRCGLESNGAPGFDEDGRLKYPLHGRIGNKSARHLSFSIDDETEEIVVRGVVDEVRFHFLKLRMTTTYRIAADSNRIEIVDEIENLSASEATIQMLYHANFGAPLLDGGTQFIAPLKEVVPRNAHAASGLEGWQGYGAAQPGFEEQVYFTTMNAYANNRTQVMLKNAHGMNGVAIDYDVEQLPCFSVWKNTTALEDGYVTGIEPGTNYPNPRDYEAEQGRVVKIGPKSSTKFELGLTFLMGEKEIAAAEAEVNNIQGDKQPTTHNAPQKGWCDDA